MVVANAAYDSNTTDIYTFNNLQYHGAVSWSWQQGLMASGISRQLGLCGLSNTTQLQSTMSGKSNQILSFAETDWSLRYKTKLVLQHRLNLSSPAGSD